MLGKVRDLGDMRGFGARGAQGAWGGGRSRDIRDTLGMGGHREVGDLGDIG